jgi:hypothetical protein
MVTLGAFIIGKIVFYYMWDLVDRGMKYFTAKPDYKKPVTNILDTLSNNKSFINDVTKLIDQKKGIDSSTADKIVKLPYAQTQIIKVIDVCGRDEEKRQKKCFTASLPQKMFFHSLPAQKNALSQPPRSPKNALSQPPRSPKNALSQPPRSPKMLRA